MCVCVWQRYGGWSGQWGLCVLFQHLQTGLIATSKVVPLDNGTNTTIEEDLIGIYLFVRCVFQDPSWSQFLKKHLASLALHSHLLLPHGLASTSLAFWQDCPTFVIWTTSSQLITFCFSINRVILPHCRPTYLLPISSFSLVLLCCFINIYIKNELCLACWTLMLQQKRICYLNI